MLNPNFEKIADYYLLDLHSDSAWMPAEDDVEGYIRFRDDLTRELEAAAYDRLIEWEQAREAGRPLGPLVNNLCYGDEDCPRCGGDPDGVCRHQEEGA